MSQEEKDYRESKRRLQLSEFAVENDMADKSYNQLKKLYKQQKGDYDEYPEARNMFLPGYEPGSDYFNRVNEPEEEKKPGRISTFYNNLVDKAKDIDPRAAKVAGAAVAGNSLLSTGLAVPLAMAAGGKYVSDKFLNTELGKNITQKSKEYADARYEKKYTIEDRVADLMKEEPAMTEAQAVDIAKAEGYKDKKGTYAPKNEDGSAMNSVEYIEKEGKQKFGISDSEMEMAMKAYYYKLAKKGNSLTTDKVNFDYYEGLAGGFDRVDEFNQYLEQLKHTPEGRDKASALMQYAKVLVNDELAKKEKN